MAKTLKVLSALLSYPTQELKDSISDLRMVLRREDILGPTLLSRVEVLIDEFATTDLYDLQERYVDLFDRGRSLSLYLFEHVHGESRDRGQAMIDLKSLYERDGLVVGRSELPDYLPLFLEFLSTQPLPKARELLGQTQHILAALAERLQKRSAPYAVLFEALKELAGEVEATETELVPKASETEPSDLLALDKEWEEEPVIFGPEVAPGCKDQLIAKIRAARRPPPGLAG